MTLPDLEGKHSREARQFVKTRIALCEDLDRKWRELTGLNISDPVVRFSWRVGPGAVAREREAERVSKTIAQNLELAKTVTNIITAWLEIRPETNFHLQNPRNN